MHIDRKRQISLYARTSDSRNYESESQIAKDFLLAVEKKFADILARVC